MDTLRQPRAIAEPARPQLIPAPALPLLAYERRAAEFAVKRLIDYSVAALLLVLLSPLLLLITLLIRLESPGPAIFRQPRAGRHNKVFTIYKFRTMQAGSEKGDMQISARDPRITRLGNFLRKTSLDELPQLLNILRGEMSLIGPRPTLPDQIARYSERQLLRLRGLPGVTGLPAVNGRNRLDWDDRIELDVQYLERWSLWLDLAILWKTVFVVLTQDGIYGADGVNRAK